MFCKTPPSQHDALEVESDDRRVYEQFLVLQLEEHKLHQVPVELGDQNQEELSVVY